MKVRFQRIISLILAIVMTVSCVIISVSAVDADAAGTYPVVFSLYQGYSNSTVFSTYPDDWKFEFFVGKTAPESYSKPLQFPTESYDLTATMSSRYVFVRPVEIIYDSIGYTNSETSGKTLKFSFVFDYSIANDGSNDFCLYQNINQYYSETWAINYSIINSDGVRQGTLGPAECDIVTSTANNARTSRVYLSAVITIPDGWSFEEFSFCCTVGPSSNVNLPVFYRYYGNQAAIYLNVYDCSVLMVDNGDILAKLEEIANHLVEMNSTLEPFYSDVVSLLYDIYTRLGSIQSVESAANTYLSSIFSKVSSVESVLSSLSNDSFSSYELLSTYLHYLQDIASNSSDIETSLSNLNDSLDTVNSYLNDFMTNYVPMWSELFSAIEGGTEIITALVSEYLGYLLNIAESSENIEAQLMALSGNVQYMSDVLKEICEIQFPYWESLFEDSTLNISVIRQYVVNCFSYILSLSGTADEIKEQFDSFYADFIAYFDLLLGTIPNQLEDIYGQLEKIYEILDKFVENYSSGNITYEFPDGYPDAEESSHFSFFRLAKAIIKGIWSFVTGIVTTFIGGLTGLISSISNIHGFFDFYRDGEIYGLTKYQGGDIWD